MEVEEATPALEASTSQPAEQGSRRPVSGERAFLLTVAQRAKEAAAAGTDPSRAPQILWSAGSALTIASLSAEWHARSHDGVQKRLLICRSCVAMSKPFEPTLSECLAHNGIEWACTLS